MTQATAAAAIPGDLSKLEAQAAEVLSPEALACILAGAGDADSTRANAAAFRRWRIKRRRGRRPRKVDRSTGTDIYRALALGADAVLIGRPYVHGLALGGEAGVRHMLRTLLAELEITLAIAGVGHHRELRPSALVRA